MVYLDKSSRQCNSVSDNTLRHYCRNPRCRSKLPSPVSNTSEAFCTRGCHSGFYRKRCLICEADMVRKTEHQLVCGKRRCRNALKAGPNLGRYAASSGGVSTHKNPTKSGTESGLKGDRAWRIVAGPPAAPTASVFHCATIGGAEAIRANDRANAQHWREHCLIKPHHPPVNVVGGYKFPDAPVVDLAPVPVSIEPQTSAPNPHRAQIPDDLSIPPFLKRGTA